MWQLSVKQKFAILKDDLPEYFYEKIHKNTWEFFYSLYERMKKTNPSKKIHLRKNGFVASENNCNIYDKSAQVLQIINQAGNVT